MVELLPSVHTLGAAVWRYREKFWVVPEESERTAVVIGVLGRLTPGLIAVIAELFQLVILPWKMFAMTSGVSFRLLTPDRLYAIEIGPITTGKYSTVLPLKLDSSAAGIGESEPAKLTTPEARSVTSLARAAAAVVDRHVGLDRLEGRDGGLLERSGTSIRSR